MDILRIVWLIVQILLGYHLVVPFILYILSLIKGKEKTLLGGVDHLEEKDYAIIVTAYEQTTFLPQVVDSLLRLNYSNYLIYIVADKCDISTLTFEDDRVVLLRPEIVLASNTRSHFHAISHFKRQHELLTIIDSDNLVDENYLNELTPFFCSGFQAVQGLRAAKNLNTTYACLDAARDIFYHYYDGEILFELNSSATLSGSGMAFTTKLYKECLGMLDITGAGFDKVLQAQIVKRDVRIAFAGKAIVYDEKTAHSDQLINQRSRWINTWFKYFGFGFNIISKGVKNLSSNQFLFGLILLRPPLFLLVLASFFCGLIDLFIYPLQSLVWLCAFCLFVVSFYISLKKYPTDKRIYTSLINIPKFIYFQLISLFHARNANKRSVATKHTLES